MPTAGEFAVVALIGIFAPKLAFFILLVIMLLK